MQLILSTLKQAFRKSIFILSLMTLICTSSLFIFLAQPSLAGSASTEREKLQNLEQMEQANEVANESKMDTYEAEVEAEKNPDKVYEKNLKAYKKANPDEGIVEKVVEGAENLVDKVTGDK